MHKLTSSFLINDRFGKYIELKPPQLKALGWDEK